MSLTNLTTKRLVHPLVIAMLVPHLAACGDIRLPRPAAPEKAMPAEAEVPNEAAAEGTGRVLLEANGEKARVVEVTGTSVESQGYRLNVMTERPVCTTTPCVVDLPRGAHTLVFVSPTDPNRGSPVDLDAGSHPKVVRHAMGERVPHTGLKVGGTVALALGAAGVGIGGLLLLTSATTPDSEFSTGESVGASMAGPGAAMVAIGGVVLAVGIALRVLGRTEVREGTTTEWKLGDGEGPRAPKQGIGTTTSVKLSPGASGLGVTF